MGIIFTKIIEKHIPKIIIRNVISSLLSLSAKNINFIAPVIIIDGIDARKINTPNTASPGLSMGFLMVFCFN